MPFFLAAVTASRITSGVVVERAADSPGVEPADAVLAEDAIPVDIAFLQLRSGACWPSRTTDGPRRPASLDKVQADTGFASNTVEGIHLTYFRLTPP